MKRKLIITLVVLFALGTAAFVYLNTYFLPIQLRTMIITKAQDFLERPMEFTDIKFNPFKGVIIRDLTIYRQDDPKAIFLKMKEARLFIPLPAIFNTQKIVIPVITLKEPVVSIIRREDGSWNFSDLLKKKNLDMNQPPPFFLSEINIHNATVELTDQRFQPALSEKFEEADIFLTLSLTKGIVFRSSFKVPSQDATLSFVGNVHPLRKETSTKAILEHVDAVKFLKFLPPQKIIEVHKGDIEKAIVSLTWEKDAMSLQGNIKGVFSLNWPDGKMAIDSAVDISQIHASKVQDQFDISAKIDADKLSLRADNAFSLNGELKSKNLRFRLGQDKSILANASFDLSNSKWRLPGDIVISGDLFASAIDMMFVNKNLSVSGMAHWKNGRFKQGDGLDISGNISAPKFSLTNEPGGFSFQAPLQISSAKAHIDNTQDIVGDFTSRETKISVKNKAVSIVTDLEVKSGGFQWEPGQNVKGGPVAQIELLYNPASSQSLTYRGWARFQNATLNGIPFIGPINGIQGKIDFIEDQLQSRGLDFLLFGTPAKVTGQMANFAQPELDIQLQANSVDIEKAAELFFSEVTKEWKFTPRGDAAILLNYKGPANKPEQATISVDADIRNGIITAEKLPEPINNITGRLIYEPHLIEWKNLALNYKGIDYKLTGNLANFNRPVVITTLIAPDFELTTTFKILNNAFTVTALKATSLHSLLDVGGEIHLQENTDPYINIKGRMNLELTDVGPLSRKIGRNFDALKGHGPMMIDGIYRGTFKDWRNATIVATAQSPNLSLYGLQFNDITAKLEQGDRQYTHLDISSRFYDGSITASSLSDPKKPHTPFTLSAKLDGINLGKLKKDTKWKKQALSGTLAANADIAGPFHNLHEVKGTGQFSIKDGALGELRMMKGIWRVLLIKELDRVVFNEASASFDIFDKKVVTHNLALRSQPLDLAGEGWIDFAKNIRFNVQADIKETAILRSNSILKSPTAILKQAEDYITVSVTGTLDNPQYERVIKPLKILEKTTGALFEGVQGIFEEIFQ